MPLVDTGSFTLHTVLVFLIFILVCWYVLKMQLDAIPTDDLFSYLAAFVFYADKERYHKRVFPGVSKLTHSIADKVMFAGGDLIENILQVSSDVENMTKRAGSQSIPVTCVPFLSSTKRISSIRDLYAQQVLRDYQAKVSRSLPVGRGLPFPVPPPGSGDGGARLVTIGIIGAGASGLFAAMLINDLKGPLQEAGLIFQHEVLEAETANSAHPVGGKLHTHRFSDGPNDYYDRGAMRFPDIPFMQPVKQLIQLLGLDRLVIPYYLSNPNNIKFFNGKILIHRQVEQAFSEGDYDPFQTGVQGLSGNVDKVINDQIGPFKAALKENFESGWAKLLEHDGWSTRGYMAMKGTSPTGPYSDQVINYLETFDTATGLYDQALSETVMDSLDFDYEPGVEWYCIQGGTGTLADAMVAKLPPGTILNDRRVTSLALAEDGSGVSVSCSSAPPKTYRHVVSTIPFSCLRTVNTSQCNFSWTLKTAIRTLHYDASTKVAIRFTTRWWEHLSVKGGADQFGGVSTTDRPTSVVVYPSYGIGGKDATMIVSYTWSQDALRLGALSGGSAVDTLKRVILKDLADMHGITDDNFLPSLVSAFDLWSWYNQENAAGAFPLFGPGQFSNLYAEVTKPVNGILHFAGEATSVHHAWVLGAMNSACRTVGEIIVQEAPVGKRDKLLNNIKELWPGIHEFDIEMLVQQVALGQHGY